MSWRSILSGLILGLLLAGATFAPSALSDPSAVSKVEKPASRSITFAGIVEVDETKLARIHARFKGRIDKLHVKVTGQSVKKGEPMTELSSPDLAVTAQNMLDARKKGNQELEQIARDRLALWGVSKDEVGEIIKLKPVCQVTLRSPVSGHVLRKHQVEGSYVEEGAPLFDVADLSTVWIEAEIKNQADVAVLETKSPVRVTAQAFAKREFRGEVLGLFQDEKTRRLKVRVTVKNPGGELLPGMRALVTLAVPAAPQAGPADKKDAKLKDLLKERLAALRALVKVASAEYQTGKVSFERLHRATMAVLHAELELCESDKERITVLEEVVALAKGYEKSALQRYQTGAAPQSDALLAKAARLEVEIALERVKAKAPARPE